MLLVADSLAAVSLERTRSHGQSAGKVAHPEAQIARADSREKGCTSEVERNG